MATDGKPCQGKGCKGNAIPGERYCRFCKGKVMLEMRTSGYLTPVSADPAPRDRDAKADRGRDEGNR